MEHTFDKSTYRHNYNGHTMVMHCHHYMCLLTRLAMEHAEANATDILTCSAEDSIRPVLEECAQRQGATTPQEVLTIGKELYHFMGMGLMSLSGTEGGGEASLVRSHLDQGWIKKWGKATIPVNFFTRGFVAATFSAAFKKPPRSFRVEESQSIARGDATSTFTVKPK
jgi:predicted hydrocarbon binding protein